MSEVWSDVVECRKWPNSVVRRSDDVFGKAWRDSGFCRFNTSTMESTLWAGAQALYLRVTFLVG